MKRRTTYAMAAMSLVVAGCVSDDPDPNLASIATGEIAEIVLDEFSFEAKTIDVVAGSTVTIRLVNAGFIDHEFMIGQVVSPGGGYDDDLLSQMVIAAEGTGFTSAGFSLADAAVHDDGDAHEPDEHMDDAAVHDDGDAHEPDEHMDDAAVHDDGDAHEPDEHMDDAAVHDDGDAHEPDEHMDDAAVHDDGDAHEPDEHMDDAAVHDDGDAHEPDEHMDDAAVHDDGDAHEPDEHMDDAAVHDDGDAHEPDEHMDDAAVHDDEAAHGHQGAHVTVEPGGVVELTLLVPADAVGTWEIGCFLEGHYEAGMLGTFNVQPSAA